jgi:hypothetical protein
LPSDDHPRPLATLAQQRVELSATDGDGAPVGQGLRLDGPVPAHPWRRGKTRVNALVIDGEAVYCNGDGVSNFEKLHSQAHNDRVFLYAYELLELGGVVTRACPQLSRMIAATNWTAARKF